MAGLQPLIFTASGLPGDPLIVSGNRHRICKLELIIGVQYCSEKLSARSEALPCAPTANLF